MSKTSKMWFWKNKRVTKKIYEQRCKQVEVGKTIRKNLFINVSFVKLALIITPYNDSCKFNRNLLKIKRVAQFKSALRHSKIRARILFISGKGIGLEG